MGDKRNLYFINSNREYRLIMSDVEEHNVMSLINAFLKAHNFKSYYTRTWQTDEGKKYDVGSHTEFFLWGFHND